MKRALMGLDRVERELDLANLGLEVFNEFLDLRGGVCGAVLGHSSDGQRVESY
jgi:hypothetical protein